MSSLDHPHRPGREEALSLVDHLRTTLYNLKAQRTRVQDAIDGYRSAATPDDEYRDLLTSCERTAEELEQQITAQEQTIAVLETLLSERWYKATRYKRIAYNGGAWTEGPTEFYVHLLPGSADDHHGGPDIITAFLKASAALKPLKGAGESKGGPANA